MQHLVGVLPVRATAVLNVVTYRYLSYVMIIGKYI